MYMLYLSNYSMQTPWTSDISIGKVQIHIVISLNKSTNVREESNIKMLSYLPLAVLPRRYVKAAFSFIVAALAVLPSWAHRRAVSLQSWIEFNSIRPAALSRAAGWSIYWQDIACHWSSQALVIISLLRSDNTVIHRRILREWAQKFHGWIFGGHESEKIASGKLLLKHHDIHFLLQQKSNCNLTYNFWENNLWKC